MDANYIAMARGLLISDYNYMENKKRMQTRNPNVRLVYDNQASTAHRICSELTTGGKVCVTLIAQPGAGKTGTFLQTAFLMCTHIEEEFVIDYKKVFIISGMQDVDWQEQTKDNMLASFSNQVYHRGQLQKAKDALRGIENAFIIIDECHIAANKNHKMSNILRECGILDLGVMRTRNIKVLEVSATPGATLYDSLSWGSDNHAVVCLPCSDIYVGFKTFLEEKRIFPSKNLVEIAEVKDLFETIAKRWFSPRWHIFRVTVNRKKVIANLERYTHLYGWNIRHHDSGNRIEDIDEEMKYQPSQHTIVVIKQFWRAGKRLLRSHVGVVHEAKSNEGDTTVTAQGLIARFCDNYHQEQPVELRPLMYCDVDAINEYNAWIDAGGDYNAVKSYRSRGLTVKDSNVTKVASTFAHSTNVQGIQVAEDHIENRPQHVGGYKIFSTLAEAKMYYKDPENTGIQSGRWSEPQDEDRDKSDRRFFLSSAAGPLKRLSYAEVLKLCHGCLTANLVPNAAYSRRLYVCYQDLTDPNSIVYVVRWIRKL
jgi:hypothetical protein